MADQDAFDETRKDVRLSQINWQIFVYDHLLSVPEFNVIVALDPPASSNLSAVQLMKDSPLLCGQVLIKILSLRRDSVLRYVVTMIDDLLEDDSNRVDMFVQNSRCCGDSLYAVPIYVLHSPDNYVIAQTSRIIIKLLEFSGEEMEPCYKTYFMHRFKEQIVSPTNPYVYGAMQNLRRLTSSHEFRLFFLDSGGLTSLSHVLQGGSGAYQLIYNAAFILWSMTFDTRIVDIIIERDQGIIALICWILVSTSKQKVSRMALGILRNLVERASNRRDKSLIVMDLINGKVFQHLETLEAHKVDDLEVIADIKYLKEQLSVGLREYSSFHEFVNEVRSGDLEWSPAHKSAQFWAENAHRLNDNNHELLKRLIELLRTSSEPKVLSICCNDIGQYAVSYPNGKNFLGKFQAKDAIIKHMYSHDKKVRYEALSALQKILVYHMDFATSQSTGN